MIILFVFANLLPSFFSQERGDSELTFASSSQAATVTCYYQSNHSTVEAIL